MKVANFYINGKTFDWTKRFSKPLITLRYTEIKCHSLLPLDEIVHIATHQDCIPEIKIAYVNFLNHCYVDTEVN